MRSALPGHPPMGVGRREGIAGQRGRASPKIRGVILSTTPMQAGKLDRLSAPGAHLAVE